MRLLFLIVPVSMLFIGCTEKSEKIEKNPVLMSSNNTELGEWANLYSIKKDPNAHSGTSVAFIDSLTLYSIGYSNKISAICKTKIDSVVFSYWALLKNDKAQAKTILSIEDSASSKNIFWAGNPMKEKVKEFNKWVEITETFKLPQNIDSKNILKLYILNNSKEEILLDDFKVAFY